MKRFIILSYIFSLLCRSVNAQNIPFTLKWSQEADGSYGLPNGRLIGTSNDGNIYKQGYTKDFKKSMVILEYDNQLSLIKEATITCPDPQLRPLFAFTIHDRLACVCGATTEKMHGLFLFEIDKESLAPIGEIISLFNLPVDKNEGYTVANNSPGLLDNINYSYSPDSSKVVVYYSTRTFNHNTNSEFAMSFELYSASVNAQLEAFNKRDYQRGILDPSFNPDQTSIDNTGTVFFLTCQKYKHSDPYSYEVTVLPADGSEAIENKIVAKDETVNTALIAFDNNQQAFVAGIAHVENDQKIYGPYDAFISYFNGYTFDPTRTVFHRIAEPVTHWNEVTFEATLKYIACMNNNKYLICYSADLAMLITYFGSEEEESWTAKIPVGYANANCFVPLIDDDELYLLALGNTNNRTIQPGQTYRSDLLQERGYSLYHVYTDHRVEGIIAADYNSSGKIPFEYNWYDRPCKGPVYLFAKDKHQTTQYLGRLTLK